MRRILAVAAAALSLAACGSDQTGGAATSFAPGCDNEIIKIGRAHV